MYLRTPPGHHAVPGHQARENADEGRIRRCPWASSSRTSRSSWRKNEDMYLFSPYGVERVYVPFSKDLGDGEVPRDGGRHCIHKRKINARRFFVIAEIRVRLSYIVEDTVNRANPIKGPHHHVEPVLGDPAGVRPRPTTMTCRTPASAGHLTTGT